MEAPAADKDILQGDYHFRSDQYLRDHGRNGSRHVCCKEFFRRESVTSTENSITTNVYTAKNVVGEIGTDLVTSVHSRDVPPAFLSQWYSDFADNQDYNYALIQYSDHPERGFALPGGYVTANVRLAVDQFGNLSFSDSNTLNEVCYSISNSGDLILHEKQTNH